MYQHDIVLGIMFSFQTGVGVLGNSFFLCCYDFTFFNSQRPRPMDLILVQLTLANTITLLSQGCPLAILFLGKRHFLGIIGCKILFYLQRVSRGLSISTTCLLNAFQAITVSPFNSRSIKLKVRALKFISPSCLLCWVFNMIIEMNVIIYIKELKSTNSSQRGGFDLFYCYWENVFNEAIILSSLRDFFCVMGMLWASGHTGFFLYRHHQRVKHIHSTGLSSRTSPEVKATQTILLMMGIFVSAYCLNCGFTLYKVYVIPSGAWVVIVSTFTSLCFPTISPFLLIRRDTQISMLFCELWQCPSHILRRASRIHG